MLSVDCDGRRTVCQARLADKPREIGNPERPHRSCRLRRVRPELNSDSRYRDAMNRTSNSDWLADWTFSRAREILDSEHEDSPRWTKRTTFN